MSAISTDTLDDIENHLRGQGGALAESLGQAFDGKWTLETVATTPWNTVAGGEDLNEAGIVVALTVEDRTLLIAIPESLPLPTWIHAPDMSQRSRMDTLAMEWSLNALPESMACEVFSTVVVSSLSEALLEADPDVGAACLPFEARRGDAVAKLWCVWPVRTVPAESPSPMTPSPMTLWTKRRWARGPTRKTLRPAKRRTSIPPRKRGVDWSDWCRSP